MHTRGPNSDFGSLTIQFMTGFGGSGRESKLGDTERAALPGPSPQN